ncbi:hypothetical protein RFM99_09270 [Mesorhizobium sp. VK4C]|nr:hypothetical protein [Mesorhizobium sp. VK4C]MDX8498611.1 hypothetical protein [Mesorhizobium sp. VK4C]
MNPVEAWALTDNTANMSAEKASWKAAQTGGTGRELTLRGVFLHS